jgi:hypothetical protein
MHLCKLRIIFEDFTAVCDKCGAEFVRAPFFFPVPVIKIVQPGIAAFNCHGRSVYSSSYGTLAITYKMKRPFRYWKKITRKNDRRG